MKRISSRKIDSTMKYLLDHPHISDTEFNAYASDPETEEAIKILKAMKAIDYKNASIGGPFLYNLHVLNDGTLYFYKKHLERIGFWKGFLTGIISTVAATLLANLIMLIMSRS